MGGLVSECVQCMGAGYLFIPLTYKFIGLLYIKHFSVCRASVVQYIQFEIQFNSYAISLVYIVLCVYTQHHIKKNLYSTIPLVLADFYIYIKMHFSLKSLSFYLFSTDCVMSIAENPVSDRQRNAFLYHQTKGRHRRVSFTILYHLFCVYKCNTHIAFRFGDNLFIMKIFIFQRFRYVVM